MIIDKEYLQKAEQNINAWLKDKEMQEHNKQLMLIFGDNKDIMNYTKGSDVYNKDEPWIQTYSGRRFNPTNPVKEAIVLQDIANALSMQCRFSGHCKWHYAVAQHSVLVSYLCDRKDAMHGLLHDASEAYLVDIPAPLKVTNKFDSYKEFEKKLQDMIYERFDLSKEEPESVRYADKLILAAEARTLLPNIRKDWKIKFEPPPIEIKKLSQEEAKFLFIRRFCELSGLEGDHLDSTAKAIMEL